MNCLKSKSRNLKDRKRWKVTQKKEKKDMARKKEDKKAGSDRGCYRGWTGGQRHVNSGHKRDMQTRTW